MNIMAGRQNSTTSLKEAIAKVKPGMTIGLSGFSYMNPPMVFVREIIRKGIKNLTIVSGPTSGIETDMLIGAGCVSKVVTSCVAFEKIAGVAPNFRKAAEYGKIKVWECDECIWHMALKAGIYNIPYILWPGAVGTDLPKLNKSLREVAVGGKRYMKIPKIGIDISFIHAGVSDIYGNVKLPENLFLGRQFCESEIAQAGREVFVSVEKIVDNKAIMRNPERTIITGAKVIEAPFGSHPGASNGFYVPDLAHYREYVECCKNGAFADYLEKYVFGPKDHSDYVRKIGMKRLESLRLKNER